MFAHEDVPGRQEGLLDVLRDYQRAHAEQGRHSLAPDLDALWRDHGVRDHHIVTLGWPTAGIDTGLTGKLSHLGSGKRDTRTYWPEAERFAWDDFAESRHGHHFLTALRARLRDSGYDYVLIDNLPGRATLARLCVVHLADVLVACFRLGFPETIGDGAGLAHDLRSRTEGSGKGTVRVLPVPMGDDRTSTHDVKRLAHNLYRKLLDEPDENARERYWGRVTVPVSPVLASLPVISAIAESPYEEGTTLKAFEALTQAITEDDSIRLKPLPEADRLKLWRLMTSQPTNVGFDLEIVSCGADAPWAEWIAAVLTRAGVKVRIGPGDAPVDTSVLLLSPRLQKAPELETAIALIADQHSTGGVGHRLVGIRVSEGPTSEVLRSAVNIDLVPHGDDEDGVRRYLLRYFSFLEQVVPVAERLPAMPRFPRRVPRVRKVSAPQRVFVGRTDVLADLRVKLRDGRGSGRPVVLTGPSGIGKSSIAAEYAARFACDYDLIWWIGAKEVRQARAELARLLPRLKIDADATAHDAVAVALDALSEGDHGPWLLIYDAADDPTELADLFPAGGPGDLLVTSQNPGWAAEHVHIRVEQFDRAESIELFLERVGRGLVTGGRVERVAERLGDHPHSVDKAGGWVAERLANARDKDGLVLEHSPDALVDQYLKALDAIPGAEGETTAERTAELALERLARELAGAVWLLRVCTYLSSDGVAMELIRSAAMREEISQRDPNVGEDLTVDEVVQMIKRFSLARVDQQLDRLCVHQHTLRTLRAGMSDAERAEARASAQLVLAAFMPGEDATGPVRERRHEELQRHVVACELGDTADAPRPVRAWAVDQVRYLYLNNDLRVAVDLAERLRDRWTKDFGESDRYRLELLVQLANALRGLGEYQQARKWDDRAAELHAEALRSNRLLGLKIKRSLAADMRAEGKFTEARRLDDRTLAEFRERLGDEHPDTLRAANNLALVFLLTGATEAAIDLDRITHETRVRVLGEQAPDTWHSLVRIGIDYRELGDYGNAQSTLKRALDGLSAGTGGDSPTALRAAQALAVTLRLRDDPEAAWELMTKTWQAAEFRYGRQHPETLSCAVSVAATHAALGRYEEALDQGRRNLDLARQIFGDAHPFTRACEANLAVYARRAGLLEEALRVGEAAWRALSDPDTGVGPAHPFALAAEIGHANTLAAAGDPEAAAEHEKHAFDSYRERLAEGHPLRGIAYTNLQVSEHAKSGADNGMDAGLRKDIDIEIPST
ncbi:FxSxx-COOH system tetratricopeptide repeat protein [Actinomadura pelletieri]|uniref:FxSxx-COOH system tetratricopeptide repeat protein n=1 Tax=Actinomadura pelletieri TaxID=111805 RepID=UPI0011C3A684|nr:FxSxx-COOH system tetratricopeptide repeat protein [Actinomadura pelletieri]